MHLSNKYCFYQNKIGFRVHALGGFHTAHRLLARRGHLEASRRAGGAAEVRGEGWGWHSTRPGQASPNHGKCGIVVNGSAPAK